MTRALTHAMIAFAATLRRVGLTVTTESVGQALRALDLIDLMDRDGVYLALRMILTSRMEEQTVFERCFDEFWQLYTQWSFQPEQPSTAAAQEANDLETSEIDPATQSDALVQSIDDVEIDPTERLDLPGQSDIDVLSAQDFSTFTSDQLQEVARLTTEIAKRLARRVSRRRKPSRRRGTLDLRGTMRANIMRDELIDLRRHARRRRRVKLVLLCDVSGSMTLYSRFLLQFLYALQNTFGRVETFAFATRLTRISDLLRGSSSYQLALASLSGVRDWSGGTRVGESLRQFNERWGRLLDPRTIVVLLSDGWDAGNPDLLAQEMLNLKRRAGKLIWLNPLLGDPTYEPLTRGMAVALPFVHTFAPAHNIDSLRMLARHLTVR